MQNLFYGGGDDQPNPSYSGTSQINSSSQNQNQAQQPSSMFGGQSGFSGGGIGGPKPNQTQGGAQDVGFHIKTPQSVKEYGYTEDKNRQFRPDMEDTCCHVDKVAGDQTCGLFGVFDGHGGKQVSEHCSEAFPIEFRKELQKKPQDLYAVYESVFQKIDSQLVMMDADHCGSTAVVAIIRHEAPHNILYVGNVGDSRATLSKNGTAERLSIDHKATDPQEIARVKSVGGSIMDNRVAGGLAITRAMGDMSYKSFGVSCSPFVVRHVLRPFDKYLIMGSDGVWDTISDQQAVDCCQDGKTTKEMAQAIVKLALEKGSGDNINCMVIKFNTGNIF